MARREFHFTDGTSNKFWAIDLEGGKFTVHYGRIGTSGQAQEKSFGSAELAQREHDKLVQEKTKKGYLETNGAGNAATAPAPVKKAAVAKDAAKKTAAVAEDVVTESVPTQAKAVPATGPMVVADTLERFLNLPPGSHSIVSWESHEPLARPTSPAFDRDAILQKLASDKTPYSSPDWKKVVIPEVPSEEEACFWLRLVIEIRKAGKKKIADIAKKMALSSGDSVPSLQEVAKGYMGQIFGPRNLLACVAKVLSTEEFLEFIFSRGVTERMFPVDELYTLVLPYLTSSDREFMRTRLKGKILSAKRVGFQDAYPIHCYLAAMIGFPRDVEALVSGFNDDLFGKDISSMGSYYYCEAPWLLFCLPDRGTVVSEVKRVGIKLSDTAQGIAWLALTGFDHLDFIVKCACSARKKEDAAAIASVLDLVVAPEAVLPALQIATGSKAPQCGIEWLRKYPLHAVVGLVPLAAGGGKLAQSARDHLHSMRRGAERPILEAAKAHLSPEGAAWLQREVLESDEVELVEAVLKELPKDLRAAFGTSGKLKLPAWVGLPSLPPIQVGDKKLAPAEVEKLLSALKEADLGEEVALFDALKKHAVRTSMDGFVWSLFDAWLTAGAPAKDKWAMAALGQLGGDAVVLKLTPLIRQWPGESQHQRAVFGLECLRTVGSDTALMALNGIAQKLKFKGLKEKAQAMMEAIAELRGMSREELADRIVPDCGLNERGGRTFDFGPRQFQFVLGPGMKPLIKDAAGKVRPDLPSPNQSDDRAKAEAEVAEWKLLKNTLKEVLKIQAERLEEAMITGRRWSPEEFDGLLVKHPLMVNLVRQLVFAIYEDGRVVSSFRVTEDQTLADENDEEIALPRGGGIGVVHPAHLSEASKSSWGQVMSDYEIIPPFAQLGREICYPEPEDLKAKELTRFRGPTMPGISVYGMLEKNHWLRDLPADGGSFFQHSKYFPSADVTAFIQYTGLYIGDYEDSQEIESVYFVPGHVKPEMWGEHKKRVKIKDLDPVVLSEVLRLVQAILSKAE